MVQTRAHKYAHVPHAPTCLAAWRGTCALRGAGQYVLGALNSNTCPGASVTIQTPEDCRSFASSPLAANKTYQGVIGSSSTMNSSPRGCYLVTGFFYFNPSPTGGTGASKQPICIVNAAGAAAVLHTHTHDSKNGRLSIPAHIAPIARDFGARRLWMPVQRARTVRARSRRRRERSPFRSAAPPCTPTTVAAGGGGDARRAGGGCGAGRAEHERAGGGEHHLGAWEARVAAGGRGDARRAGGDCGAGRTEYRITTGAPIYLRFYSFATESGYDTVEVYDGTSSSGTLKGSFSGTAIPPVQSATSGSMFIRFTLAQ